MVKRRIDPASGMEALRAWRGSCERGEDASRAVVLTAVRFTLEELGALHPGRSVEVRVPPAGAVQILPGTRIGVVHRPPSWRRTRARGCRWRAVCSRGTRPWTLPW